MKLSAEASAAIDADLRRADALGECFSTENVLEAFHRHVASNTGAAQPAERVEHKPYNNAPHLAARA